jgi:hypothetical protein
MWWIPGFGIVANAKRLGLGDPKKLEDRCDSFFFCFMFWMKLS